MATDDAPARLAPEFEKLRSTQSYAPRPRIAGVETVELKRFVEEGGELAEIARLDDRGRLLAFPSFQLRQINHAVAEPGAIKAFHVHLRQSDVWFVPPSGRLLVGLLDARDGSPSRGVRQRVTLGAGRALLLLIPPGVAHGCTNLSRESVTVTYLHDRPFDSADPDEHRLPWDALGAEFWTIPPG